MNGTSTATTYDNAGRIDVVQHKLGATILLALDYNYTADGLIDRIDETDSTGTYVLNYTYDKRGRLIAENRMSGTTALYSYSFTYDQLGNRLSKTDHVAWQTTTYTYDVHDAADLAYSETHNNRLLRAVTTPVGGGAATAMTWYAYTRGGHVKQILHTDDPDGDQQTGITPYKLTCLDYNVDQQLWLIRKYGIEVTGGVPSCTEPLLAREFRYDSGRQRYWSRERDPDTLIPSSAGDLLGWREYLGDSIYAELSAEVNQSDPGVVDTAATRRYLHAGDGRLIGWMDGEGDWQIVHADHLGSTRLVTGASGAIGRRLGYSAFGEVLSDWLASGAAGTAAKSRYGYCGGWGYEDDALADPGNPLLETGLLHVGARYYAPGLGRFVQRDPISIEGGPNVYSYALNSPTMLMDANGHMSSAEIISVAAVVGGVIATIGAITQGVGVVTASPGLINAGTVLEAVGSALILPKAITTLAKQGPKWWKAYCKWRKPEPRISVEKWNPPPSPGSRPPGPW